MEQNTTSRTRFMQTRMFKPVWFFNGELDRLVKLMEKMGPVSISTEGGTWQSLREFRLEHPYDSRTFALLCMTVEAYASVLIQPTRVQVSWWRNWEPPEDSEEQDDPLAQVCDLIESRRHYLFFLGEREWQLLAGSISLAVLQGCTVLNWWYAFPQWLLTVAGLQEAVVILWTLVGTRIPSRTHVAISRITRSDFLKRVRYVATAVAIPAAVATAVWHVSRVAGLHAGVGVGLLMVGAAMGALGGLVAQKVYVYVRTKMARKRSLHRAVAEHQAT